MKTARIRRMLHELHLSPSPSWVLQAASLGEDRPPEPERQPWLEGGSAVPLEELLEEQAQAS